MKNMNFFLIGFDSQKNLYYDTIKSTVFSKDKIVNLYMDIENQQKLVDCYTETSENLLTVYTSERPEGEIVADIVIMPAKLNYAFPKPEN